jgi:hypothetical protein
LHKFYLDIRTVARFILLAILGATASAAERLSDPRTPLVQIDLADRAPAMIGAELGRAYAERFPGLERAWDHYLYQAFSASGGDAQARFDRLLRERIEPLRAHGIADAVRAEVEGLASTWALFGGNRLGDGRLSPDELWAAQLLADIGAVGGGVGYAVFGDATADGGPIVGLNRDALVADAEEPPTVITVRRDGQRRSALIGFAGQVAPPLGMNDRGLFVAQLPVPASTQSSPSRSPESIGFAVRRALERESRVAAVAGDLSGRRFAEGHAVLIADHDRAAVLEQAAGAAGRLRTDSSPTRPELAWARQEQIAAVDCPALERSRSACLGLRQIYRWERLQALARFEAHGTRARVDDVAAILLDTSNPPYALRAPDTREALIYGPREELLYLRPFSAATSGIPDAFDTPEEAAPASTLRLYHPLRIEDEESGESNAVSIRLLIWTMLGLLSAALILIRLRLRLHDDPSSRSGGRGLSGST